MAGRWEHFPHGADVGIRGIGATQAEAFAQAARALTAILVDPDAVRPTEAVEIACSGRDPDDLLYAWLNTLIYEMAIRHMLFGRFKVTIKSNSLTASAWGEPVARRRHRPAVEVKGATYTMLAVRHERDRWVTECVVDV